MLVEMGDEEGDGQAGEDEQGWIGADDGWRLILHEDHRQAHVDEDREQVAAKPIEHGVADAELHRKHHDNHHRKYTH